MSSTKLYLKRNEKLVALRDAATTDNARHKAVLNLVENNLSLIYAFKARFPEKNHKLSTEDDFFQELWLKLFQAADTFKVDSGAGFSRWAFISMSQAYKALRRHYAYGFAVPAILKELPQTCSTDNIKEPSAAFEDFKTIEDFIVFEPIFEMLGDTDCIVLEQIIAGVSHKETAQFFGISPQAAAQKRSRVLAILSHPTVAWLWL